MSLDTGASVRLAAFAFLDAQRQIFGDSLPRAVLSAGFTFQGQRVPLVGPQGIFKPAAIAAIPLSITTSPEVTGRARPYEDHISADGDILYRYRGTNPDHPENVGLRLAMEKQIPLIHFEGLDRGLYFARYPAYIVGDDAASLTFHVLADEVPQPQREFMLREGEDDARRRYVTRLSIQRLHQAKFRVRVLRAYRYSCSICRLKHGELLDAAHILPDRDPRSAPVVPNGLGLCKLHHAALDANIIGIRPDLVVEVRRDVLEEVDGPMLLHGLQGVTGSTIQIPRRPDQHPNREFLEERFERFRLAG